MGLAAILTLVLISGTVEAQDKGRGCRSTEMRLELTDIRSPWVTAIHPTSGWQITALLRAKECALEGIGVAGFPPHFPGADQGPIYIVFDDPDHCPSFLGPGTQLGVHHDFFCEGTPNPEYPDCEPPDWRPELTSLYGDPCLQSYPVGATEILTWDKDETWLEITPGRSAPAPVSDFLPAGVEEEFGPLVWTVTSSGWDLSPQGPNLGTTADDVRFGSWRRMPGLVVLADHGPGLLTTPPDPGQPPSVLGDGNPVASDFFDPSDPLTAWNLAGLFGSAAYSLMGGNRETSALAHLNVPRGLFTPVVLIDKEITYATHDDFGVLCEPGDTLYRMDGGPLTCHDGPLGHTDSVINATKVSLRVFAVDGEAPDILVDMNNDGYIDKRDALQMGLKPITPEARTQFTQYHELECGVPFDFDGDGNPGGCVLGARPGGITRPPR
jgi:hypothetical protein